MVQYIPLEPAPSIGTMLGQGLGQGMAYGAQLSLSDKMQALQEQRKIKLQRDMNEAYATEAENQGFPREAKFIRAFGLENLKMGKEYGMIPSYAVKPESQEPAFQGGFREPVSTEEPMQNLQALQQEGTGLPQYDMAVGQGVEPQMTQPPQFPKAQQVQAIQQMSPQTEPVQKEIFPSGPLKSLDDYARKIARAREQDFDQMQGPPRKAILEEAKARRDADIATRKLDIQERGEKQKLIGKYVGDVRQKGEIANSIRANLDEVENLLDQNLIGPVQSTVGLVSAKNRAAKATMEVANSSIVGSYKGLFPRGLTDREFNYIAQHWGLSPYNTVATNKAIIQAHKKMIRLGTERLKVLNEQIDENGNLPENIENLVEKKLGKEYIEAKHKITETVPPGTIATENDVREISNITGKTGKELLVEMRERGFKIPKG